jgi:hypothetical protein
MYRVHAQVLLLSEIQSIAVCCKQHIQIQCECRDTAEEKAGRARLVTGYKPVTAAASSDALCSTHFKEKPELILPPS